MSLVNKTILITGAAGALGHEVTRVAKSQGANVVLVDLAFPEEIANSNHTINLDLTNATAVQQSLSEIDNLNAVFNIAGGFDMGPTLYEMEQTDWDKMFALNVTTCKNVIAATVPAMIACGGAIVNIGAFGALSGAGNMSAYCASKSVVMNMTQSLSEEVKGHGINVNAVLPSIIDTQANRAAMPDANFDEWVTTEQLANVMCFLASDAASGVHGALLPVRGLS